MTHTRLSAQLRADCIRCCALCCVGPSFEAEQGFGFDKAASTPCANLRSDNRCAIHAERRQRGFPACITFDCYGAGQRVTERFGGKSWRSSPELASQMFNAYSRYRTLHELMALLEMAILKVSPRETLQLEENRRFIDELCESGAALAQTVRVDELRKDVLNRVRDALTPRAADPRTDDQQHA